MSSVKSFQPAMHHTMLRVADPERSMKFYDEHFGMKLLVKLGVPELGFTNYMLGLDGEGTAHNGKAWYEREGILELNHTHNLENFQANNGNKDPSRGFGHICFSVANLAEKCAELEKAGVKFQKRLTDGRMKTIAFALDPDGYWIELIENKASNPGTRFNHSMIRVKDPKKSLNFYVDTLGMTLIDEMDNTDAGFKLYFLSYKLQHTNERSNLEGIIELTHNFGTESQADFHYHNGNEDPVGFGHFGLTVSDVAEAEAQIKSAGYNVVKSKQDGPIKWVAFVQDPDGYWLELLPRAPLPDPILS